MSLLQKIESGTFVHTVEINPPASHNPADALAEVDKLPSSIDAIDITNCAFSKVRISPVALGKLISDHSGHEIIINYTCRDRNIIATKSDLLGALALGIEHVLCMTGDDPKIGDHPEASGVFDLDTCKLITLCKELQSGDHTFAVSAAAAPATDEVSLQKLQAKVDAGTDYFITQPVYTLEDVDTIAALQEKAGKPFILGLLPFKGADMAKRLAAVPGITVPDSIIDLFEKHEASGDVGEFSVESLAPIAARAREVLSGIHVMPIGEVWKVDRLLAT